MLSKVAAAMTFAAVLAPAAAHAGWIKAESDRFIVYGDSDAQQVRDYAVKLTTYDALLRFLNPAAAAHQPDYKVQVYLVRGHRGLIRVNPNVGGDVAGFYVAQPQGVFAVAQTGNEGLEGDDVLFHEYAHHFMLENFQAAYPAWFVEGWAEYYMTTDITPKGIQVGRSNDNRVNWLYNVAWLPMEDVLSKSVGEIGSDDVSLYYAQAWQLMHYMQDSPERAKQLDQATRAIAAGEAPVKALEKATGMSVAELTKVLKKYQRKQVLTVTNFHVNPQVTVTALPASADDLLLDEARLQISDVGQPDPGFLAEVRAHASRYPGDRLAELTLAHAEFTFGDVAVGEKIVNRWLAAQANDVELQRLAGVGQMLAGKRRPAERDERFRAARAYLAKAAQLDPKDYRPLLAYAETRRIEPNYPTDNDVNVLLKAHRLAPAVATTSLMAGEALIRHNERDAAIRILASVANNPHGGSYATQAKALISGAEGKAADKPAH